LKAAGASPVARLAALRGRLPGEEEEALQVWDLAAGKRVQALQGLAQFPGAVEISPDGRFLAFRDPTDESVRVWDVGRRHFTNRLRPPGGASLSAPFPDWGSFSPDGSFLAVRGRRGGEQVLWVWDVETGKELAALPEVCFYDWPADSHALVVDGPSFTGAEDDFTTGPGIPTAISRDGDKEWAFKHGILSCWELARPTPSYALDYAVKWLCLNKGGSRLVANDLVCEVVRGRHGQVLLPSAAPRRGLFPVFGRHDELWVAAHADSWDQPPTRLWQLTPQQREVTLPDAGYPDVEEQVNERGGTARRPNYRATVRPFRLAFSPTEPVLLRAVRVSVQDKDGIWGFSRGKGLELWDYQKRKRLAVWGKLDEGWRCFQFSPDGRRVVTGGGQGLKVWAVDTGEVETTLSSQPVDELRLSPDGRRVLAVKAGERAGLFEVDTGRQVQSWQVAKGAWQAFALNPDGTLVASGGEDKNVRLWDAATGRELAHWRGHDGAVTALLFSHDGNTLYSGSQDGTLKLWDLPFIREELKKLGLDW
jgi:WD40 repeat protein